MDFIAGFCLGLSTGVLVSIAFAGLICYRLYQKQTEQMERDWEMIEQELDQNYPMN